MSRRLAVAAVAVVWLLAACEKKSEPKGQAPATGGPPAAAKVEVLVDGKPAVSVDPGRAAQYPPIGALLTDGARDPRTWASIEVKPRTGDVRTIGADEQPGRIAALYPDRGGTAFGMFTPDELGKKGKPPLAVLDVVEVRITLKKQMEGGGGGGDSGGGGDHEGGGERPVPTADLKIDIKTASGTQVFTGDKLVAMATVTAPTGDMETPGWTIQSILKATGVEPKGTLFLEGAEGASLLLEPGDLDESKVMLYVKLNRQGQLRFRMFKKTGEVWDVAGELRGISRIEVR
jgi:hypothetical protein